MKVYIHRSEDRGKANHGWLRSNFSFSFAGYFNRNRMGFGALRVLNDDTIEQKSGFPMHPHDNMEIVTIVTEGVLEHKDSLGNGSVIKPGEVQRMSAGKGIVHSEWNPSDTELLKLFQIWIQTRDDNIEPEYEQASFDFHGRKDELITVVSGEKEKEGLTFHQDAMIKRGIITSPQTYTLNNKDNGLFVFVINGEVSLAGETITDRDSAEITEVSEITITPEKESDILLIEVPI